MVTESLIPIVFQEVISVKNLSVSKMSVSKTLKVLGLYFSEHLSQAQIFNFKCSISKSICEALKAHHASINS